MKRPRFYNLGDDSHQVPCNGIPTGLGRICVDRGWFVSINEFFKYHRIGSCEGLTTNMNIELVQDEVNNNSRAIEASVTPTSARRSRHRWLAVYGVIAGAGIALTLWASSVPASVCPEIYGGGPCTGVSSLALFVTLALVIVLFAGASVVAIFVRTPIRTLALWTMLILLFLAAIYGVLGNYPLG